MTSFAWALWLTYALNHPRWVPTLSLHTAAYMELGKHLGLNLCPRLPPPHRCEADCQVTR